VAHAHDGDVKAEHTIEPRYWLIVGYEEVVKGLRETFSLILRFADLDWTSVFESGFARYEFRA